MTNLIYLVGRLSNDPIIKSLSDDEKVVIVNVAVPKQIKNRDGTYSTDIIPCKMYGAVAKNVCEHCKTDDLVGIKGRIQIVQRETDLDNGNNIIEIVVDKFTYLSSGKEN